METAGNTCYDYPCDIAQTRGCSLAVLEAETNFTNQLSDPAEAESCLDTGEEVINQAKCSYHRNLMTIKIKEIIVLQFIIRKFFNK